MAACKPLEAAGHSRRHAKSNPRTGNCSDTTPSRTVTPTPTPSPFGPTINVVNAGTYSITNIQVNNITIPDINFPILSSQSAIGHTTVYSTSTSITVTLSQGSFGESITVNNDCQGTDGGGDYSFIGVNTTVGTITIGYMTGSCQ